MKKKKMIIGAVAALLLILLAALLVWLFRIKPKNKPDNQQAVTGTAAPTEAANPTSAEAATNTPAPTATAEPANTSAPTATPEATSTPTATATPEPTSTPTHTATSTPVPTSTPAPTATSTPTPTPFPLGSFTPVSGYKVESGGGGIIVVSKDGKYGAMNSDGELVVECSYDLIKLEPNKEGYFCLLRYEKDESLYDGKGGACNVAYFFNNRGELLHSFRGMYFVPSASHLAEGKLLYFSDDYFHFYFSTYDINTGEVKQKEFVPGTRDFSYTFGMVTDGYAYFEALGNASYRISLDLDIEKIEDRKYEDVLGKVTLSDGKEYSELTYCNFAPTDGWRLALQYDKMKIENKPSKTALVGIHNINTNEYRYIDLTAVAAKFGYAITAVSNKTRHVNGIVYGPYGQLHSMQLSLDGAKAVRVLVDFSKGNYDNNYGNKYIASNVDDMIVEICEAMNLCDNGYFHCMKDGRWYFRKPDGTIVNRYQTVGRFMNGYAPVLKDGIAYLINENEEIVHEFGPADNVGCTGYLYYFTKDKKTTYFWLK